MSASEHQGPPAAAHGPFRDGSVAARQRLVVLKARHLASLHELGPVVALHARRMGRVVGGSFASLLGIATLLGSLILASHGRATVAGFGMGPFTLLLVQSWPLSLAAGVLARLLTLGWTARRARAATLCLLGSMGPGGRPGDADPQQALDRLERTPLPPARVARAAARLEVLSLALPMVGLSLLAPLTLHLPFGALFGTLAGYDGWIMASAAIVGHAHLVLAILAIRLARRIGRTAEPLPLDAGVQILGYTVLAAAIPGILVWALPPIITAVTGAFFVPWMCRRASRLAPAERELLAPWLVPRAAGP